MGTQYPLSLIIKAVDKASAPLREINKRFAKFTGPVRKLNNSFRSLAAEAGLPRLTKSLAGVGRAVSSVGSEAMALGLKLAGIATGAAVGLYAIVRSAVDAGDKLSEMSQRVGLSVDAYAQLQYAAAQADVEQEAFNGAMDQFNKRLGEAKAGGGPLLSFLNQVAPGLGQAVRGSKNTEDALRLMTDAFERVKDPGKRAALSAAAFGKSGLQMGQFLGQGNRALAEQRAEFARIAGSQEKFARDAGELDNAARRTGIAFGALRNAAMAKLFPALVKLSDAVTDLVVKHGDKAVAFFEKVEAEISKWVEGGGVGDLAKQIGELVESVKAAVEWMGGWKVAAGLVLAIMAGPLLASIVGLASAFVTLGMAIGFTPIGWFLLGITAIAGAAYLLISNWSKIGTFFSDLFSGVKAIFESFSDLVYSVLIGDMEKAWESLKGIFAGGAKVLATILDGVFGVVELVLSPILKPLQYLFGLAGVQTGDMPSLRKMLGADTAAPGAPGRGGDAHVTIDITGATRGTRVTADPKSTAPIDLSMGYSMIGSH